MGRWIVAALVIGFARVAAAQWGACCPGDEAAVASLKGMSSVVVVVDDGSPEDGRKLNIDVFAIKTATELSLRRAGIKVVDDIAAAGGVLAVRINEVIGYSGTTSATCYSVEVDQPVTVPRNGKAAAGMLGITWMARSVCVGGLDPGDFVKQKISGLADQFLNDWLKANGK